MGSFTAEIRTSVHAGVGSLLPTPKPDLFLLMRPAGESSSAATNPLQVVFSSLQFTNSLYYHKRGKD